MTYTEGFKSNMIRKMARPNGISASALAKEVGVPQQSLSRWLRNANVVDEPGNSSIPNELGRRMPPKRPQDKPAEEKLKIVMEAETLAEDQLGAFLRRNGIHEAQLCDWRGMMLLGLQKPVKPSSKPSEGTPRIHVLEKELLRKDKALAEAAAILILKKKSNRSGGTRTTPRTRRTADDRPTY